MDIFCGEQCDFVEKCTKSVRQKIIMNALSPPGDEPVQLSGCVGRCMKYPYNFSISHRCGI